MNLIQYEHIKELISLQREHCVSIYIPTTYVAVDYTKNSSRLKNMLNRADEMLEAQGVRKSGRDELLETGWAHLKNIFFQQRQKLGLAMFLSDGFARSLKLPVECEETVIVSGHFYLKPLLKLVSGNGRYFLLAVSKHEVKLYQGSRFTLAELNPEKMPRGMNEALRIDKPESGFQYHSAASGGPAGKMPVIYHGQGYGSGNDRTQEKKNLLRFFRRIDRALNDWITSKKIPLVLAAVDYLHPLYTEANTYPSMLKEGIDGNPAHMQRQELMQRAWDIVGPVFRQTEELLLDEFDELKHTERTSYDIRDILRAAFEGRVQRLGVVDGIHEWGVVQPDTNHIEIHAQQQAGDVDLYDEAMLQSLRQSADVLLLDKGRMPDGAGAVAVYRY
ncbi:MAG: hypothetical protein JW881_08975 [Spirochaetales bacterium]|nr:hypothetical protein [Spirochaetales bacterium]